MIEFFAGHDCELVSKKIPSEGRKAEFDFFLHAFSEIASQLQIIQSIMNTLLSTIDNWTSMNCEAAVTRLPTI